MQWFKISCVDNLFITIFNIKMAKVSIKQNKRRAPPQKNPKTKQHNKTIESELTGQKHNTPMEVKKQVPKLKLKTQIGITKTSKLRILAQNILTVIIIKTAQ